MDSSSERETAVYVAELAEQAHRFDEMVEAMKKVAKMGVELTENEMNLLSAAYKNETTSRRASWKILSSIEKKEESTGNELRAKWAKDCMQKVETEMTSICGEIISIIDDHLIPSGTSGESTVFNYKMKGDYCRYLAGFKTGDDRKELADQALKAYEKATEIAEEKLHHTNPIRLGLALNLSVFYHEILNSHERACDLARKAFNDAFSDLGSLDGKTYKDSYLIVERLSDNLTLWTSDIKDGAEGEGEGEDEDEDEGEGEGEGEGESEGESEGAGAEEMVVNKSGGEGEGEGEGAE